MQKWAIRIVNNPIVTESLTYLDIRWDSGSLSVLYHMFHGECFKDFFEVILTSHFYHRTAHHKNRAYPYYPKAIKKYQNKIVMLKWSKWPVININPVETVAYMYWFWFFSYLIAGTFEGLFQLHWVGERAHEVQPERAGSRPPAKEQGYATSVTVTYLLHFVIFQQMRVMKKYGFDKFFFVLPLRATNLAPAWFWVIILNGSSLYSFFFSLKNVIVSRCILAVRYLLSVV